MRAEITEVMMATDASFLPGAGLLTITRGFSRARDTEGCDDLLKVVAVFSGLIFAVLLLLASAALNSGFF